MSSRIWGTDTTLWSAACWPWGECTAIPIIEIIGRPGVDAETLIQPWQREEEPWDAYRQVKDKKKRFIELICTVKGINYDSKKEIKKFTLSVDETKMIVNAVSGVEVKINENLGNIQNNQ